MKSQQQDISKLTLSQRLTHHSWKVRKQSYDQLYYLLQEDPEQITIANNEYNIHKLIPFFNNLTDQHHATVLLQGLNCVQKLLSHKQLGSKYFLKLLNEGLEKFPLMTQLRKPILQKFMDILTQVQIQPRMLKDKLQLPQQKSVMYTLQVIGILGIESLKNDIKSLSEKHHKKCIRQLAAEIYEQMVDKDQNISTNPLIETKAKKTEATTAKNQKKVSTDNTFTNKKMQIIQKLPHYEQLSKRQQQNYSCLLLQSIPAILSANSLNMDLGHFIRLMIEQSNHVISANGVKILTIIMNQNSKLIPLSYPLAFYLEKFKLHPTHPVNGILLELTDSIMKAGRVNDLLQAVYDGFNGNSIKANVKFGAINVLMRVIYTLYRADEQFTKMFNSKGIVIDYSFKNQKFEKLLAKVCSVISKDKKYKNYVEMVQAITNEKYPSLKSSIITKQTPKSVKQPSQNPSRLSNYTSKNTLSVSKPAPSSKAPSISSSHKNEKVKQSMTISTQAVLNQIIEICDKHQILPQRQKQKNILQLQNKLKFLKNDLLGGLANNKYNLFFLSETLMALVCRYAPVAFQETSQVMSSYIVQLLQELASYRPKFISKSSRDSITIILTICLCELVLKDQLQNLLKSLLDNYSIKLILEAISYIDGKVKKKNKKILIKWIQTNITQELIDQRYHKIMQCIQQGKTLFSWSIQQNNVYKTSPSETPKKQSKGKNLKIENQQEMNKKQVAIVNTSKQSVVKTINKHRSATTMSIEPSQLSNQQQINIKLNTSEYDRIQQLSKQDISFPSHQISGIAHKDQDEQKWQYFLNKHKVIQNTPRIMVKELQKAGKKSYQLESQEKVQNTFLSNENQQLLQENKQMKIQQEQDFRKEMERWRNQQIQNNRKKIVQPIQVDLQPNFSNHVQQNHHQQSQSNKIQREVNSPKFREIQPKSFARQSLEYTPQNNEGSEINQSQYQQSHMSQQKSYEQKYQLLNVQKLNYMLNCTANPYPHLRTLILIPFKSLTKKNQFLMEFSAYLQSRQLKHPQPYNGVLLLVILLFTQIKTDKTLIGPLQQLYQFLASSCSTNDFLKTLFSLLHSVIQETLSISRSFLLTILSKSICRLLPYVEDSVQMLRDVQQFYQIGEMVYFQMYEQEYQQIKTAIEGQCLNSLVHQALQKQGQNLIGIVEGWLQTKFKQKVKQYLKQ